MLQNATFLLLAVDMAVVGMAIGIALCIVGIVIAILGLLKVTSARKVAEKIKADAINECKTLKKEAIVEAKEQEHKLRSEFEKESREKRAELLKMEQRLNQKDEILNKKDASLLKRNEEVEALAKSLDAKHVEADNLMQKLEAQHDLFVKELEKVAQMTQDEAKTMIIEEVKDDARKEASLYVRNAETQAKEEADKMQEKIKSMGF